MSRLLSLLKAAAGEASLHSPLGRWRQAVSLIVDTLKDGIFDSLTVLGNINFWTSQNGGWRDMVGQAAAQGAASEPSYLQIGGTDFYGYKFDVDNSIQFIYHIQHDYSLGTPLFFHAHWTSDGTDEAPVVWQWQFTFARGFDQGNFDFANPVVVTAQQSTNGTVYRGMTTEIAVGVEDALFEPDTLVVVRLVRVTNGAVDNADGIFLQTADVHYQVNTIATKNRVPNFYSP